MVIRSSNSRFRFVGELFRVAVVVLALMTMGAMPQFIACALPSADFAGLTTGGQQDIAAARAAIERGEVPDPDAITVEGLLSEHSIPVDVPNGAGLLYMTAATAWHKDFDEFTPLVTVQIGFGTTLDLSTFRRSPQNLCLVIDRSGSMAELIDERSGTSKFETVLIAIDRLLGRLDVNDRVSVVTFNNGATVRLESALGKDLEAVKDTLQGVVPTGDTDLAVGLRAGYRVLADNQIEGRQDRLIVFTDALLSDSHEAQVREFIDVMEVYADRGMGATIFGVGTDFGEEIAYDISQVRGGNYFFLSDYDRIVKVFDEEFDFLVTPIAYDVSLTVDVPPIFDVVDVYGIPVDEGTLPHQLELSVPSLFLSNRKGGGAIITRVRAGASVDFAQANTVAELSLAYTTPDGERLLHERVTAELVAGVDPEAAESYFESDATQRAALLVDTALALKRACEDVYGDCRGFYYGDYYCGGNWARAKERLTEFLDYFDQMSADLEDQISPQSRSLSQERGVVVAMLDIVSRRVP